MWETLKKICCHIDTIFDQSGTVLIIIGGSLITLTVVLQVLLRYVFKAPLFGLEEFSRLIAVWVYFLGAIFGIKQDSHVQGDVAGLLFNTPTGLWWPRIISVGSMLFGALFMTIYSIANFIKYLQRAITQTTEMGGEA